MIFSKHRSTKGWFQFSTSQHLTEQHWRIMWATWHLASVFGILVASILFHYSMKKVIDSSVLYCMLFGLLGAGLLVGYATRGKHPGWIVLLLIATLIYLGLQ